MRVTKQETEKQETVNTNLVELCTLWKHVSEHDQEYLSGMLSEELNHQRVIGFYNITKKNEKEPDIRIYSLNDENKKDINIMSLWNQTSKDNKKYLSGITNDNENIVAFFNENDDDKQPIIRVYLRK